MTVVEAMKILGIQEPLTKKDVKRAFNTKNLMLNSHDSELRSQIENIGAEALREAKQVLYQEIERRPSIPKHSPEKSAKKPRLPKLDPPRQKKISPTLPKPSVMPQPTPKKKARPPEPYKPSPVPQRKFSPPRPTLSPTPSRPRPPLEPKPLPIPKPQPRPPVQQDFTTEPVGDRPVIRNKLTFMLLFPILTGFAFYIPEAFFFTPLYGIKSSIIFPLIHGAFYALMLRAILSHYFRIRASWIALTTSGWFVGAIFLKMYGLLIGFEPVYGKYSIVGEWILSDVGTIHLLVAFLAFGLCISSGFYVYRYQFANVKWMIVATALGNPVAVALTSIVGRLIYFPELNPAPFGMLIGLMMGCALWIAKGRTKNSAMWGIACVVAGYFLGRSTGVDFIGGECAYVFSFGLTLGVFQAVAVCLLKKNY